MTGARQSEPTPAAPLTAWRFLRAVLVSLVLLPFAAYWCADEGVDVIVSLAVPPVFALLLLVAVNRPLLRFVPRFALSTGELILIYSMVSVGTAIGSEWMSCMNPQIHCYALFGNDTNHFETLMLPHLSRLFFLKDAEPLRDYQAGGGGWPQVWGHLSLWARPVLAWTALTGFLSLAMLSINSLMRRQWTQQERLSFPIIQFPYALVEAGGSDVPPLWRDPWLWGAAAVMGLIDLVNGLHFLWPGVPWLRVRFLGDLNLLFSSPPWNSTGWTPVGLF
ncbi:MAG: hypothetical protein HYU66_22905, partial [Armatimonadetes bacterium]|nr:hypothetical protein [Armatimonadota bacterium]